MLPLDERGYGFLIGRTVAGARALHGALGGDLAPFGVVRLPEPDINIACFVVRHPTLRSLAELNRFNEAVYRQLSLHRRGGDPEYIVTRTRLTSPHYDGAVDPVLAGLDVPLEAWRADRGGLVVLRATVMDPFLIERKPATDHVAGFIGALRRACEAALGPQRSRSR